MPTLTVQLPGAAPVSHVLKDETSTVGRMKGNTVVIEDGSISLMHARITRRNGEFYLKDLNSTNGTMVNGQPISEVKLRDKDKIRFAEVTTHFDMSDAVVAGASTSPVAASAVSAPAPAGMAIPLSATPVKPGTPTAAASMPAPAPSAPAVSGPRPMAAAPMPLAALPAPVNKHGSPSASPKSSSRKKGRSKLVTPLALAACIVLGVGGYVGYNEFVGKGEKVAARDVPVTASRLVAERPNNSQVSGKPAASAAAAVEPSAPNAGNLAKGLKNQDVAERRKAATALHGLGPEAKEASTELKDALKDSDSEVQMWAALTLSKNAVYDKAEVPILVRGLQHENPVLRQVVCLSMGLLPFEPAEKDMVVPALAEAVRKDADEDVRAAAQSALSVIAPELVQNTSNTSSGPSAPP